MKLTKREIEILISALDNVAWSDVGHDIDCLDEELQALYDRLKGEIK